MAVPATIDAIKAAVETAAIAVGGLWAAWTFHKLQSVRAADADINNKLTEARESERRLLSQQPNLDITFSEIMEQDLPNAEGGSLIVSVEIRNSGLRNLEVLFDQATLGVGRFQIDDAPTTRIVNVHRTGPYYLGPEGDQLWEMPYRIFRAGQHRNCFFLSPVSEPGLYLVQFQAVYRALPFEGEQLPEVEAESIIALEQRIVSITGKGTGASSVPLPATPPVAG
jgi:hypothetical protein